MSDLSLSRITTINGYPEVSRAGESSVPGLYFAGAPTAHTPWPARMVVDWIRVFKEPT